MSIVILAEKPSQGKDYSGAFQNKNRKDGYIEVSDPSLFKGKQVFITWGFGHLIQMASPEHYKDEWKQWTLEKLPILPQKYKFVVGSNKGVKKQFSTVKKLLQKAEMIVVASDADREGENIARSIIEQAGVTNKPIKRLWINSLVVDEIRKGFQNLRNGKDYELFYKEAQTRQISDWLVGMNGSRLYTLLLQQKGLQGVFSVGRVQTPALYQIYKRQKEIENFTSKPFYEVFGDAKVDGGSFIAKYNEKYDSEDVIQAFLNGFGLSEGNYQGVVKMLEKTVKKKASPKLHSLSTLQGRAGSKWGYNPAEVLKIVQELYEKKVLSYPRTDTQFITENEFAYLKRNLDNYMQVTGMSFDTVYLEPRKRYVDGSKVQEHYAIIPTEQVADINELSAKEKNIYKEVMETTLAMFADDYHYEETTIDVDVEGLVLTAKGNTPKKQGWKDVVRHSSNTPNKDKKELVLPRLHEGESCYVDLYVKEGMTKPPKAYKVWGLIGMMKRAGSEVEDEEIKDTLKEVEGIGTEATRSSIIETLKKQEYIEVKKNTVYVTQKGVTLCNVIEESLLASPEMTAKWEQYLAKIGDGSGTQEKFLDSIQRFILSMIETAPINIDKNKELLQSSVDENTIGNCPSCECGMISDRGKFYGCSNYRNGCKFTLPKKLASKTIPKKQILNLVNDGKTTKIKGFKSKKDKKFDASLKLEDGKVKFDFGE